MRIKEIPFEPCTRIYDEFKVGELHDGTSVDIPFVVINGSEKGKTLLVTAGMNGNIYSAIEAARQIILKVKPRELKGRLVVIPIVNKPAFLARSRANTFEIFPGPVQMVGGFPGNPSGMLTERIAHAVTQQAILDADCYVDIGTGALGGCFAPYVVMYPMPEESIEKVAKLARAFGVRFILDQSKVAPPNIKGRAAQTALSNGIPAILSEMGEASRLDKIYVDTLVRGVNNVMVHLGMMEGKLGGTPEHVVLSETVAAKTSRGGFLKLNVELGDSVKKGQTVAEISDVFYNQVESVESQVDGYVLRIATACTVSSGEAVVSVGIPVKK